MNKKNTILYDLNLNAASSINIDDMMSDSILLFQQYYDIKSTKLTNDFYENKWEFYELTANAVKVFDFNRFISAIQFNKNIDKKEFINVLKCWVIQQLSFLSPLVVHKKINILFSIIKLTNGLTTNFETLLELAKNNKVYSLNGNNGYYTKKVTSNYVSTYILVLLDFQIFYGKKIIESETTNELRSILSHLKIKNRSRVIPDLSDMLNFKDCIEEFYKDFSLKKDKEILILYFPIILWWELCSIIPIRPAEFCLLKRNCLNNNKISIPRLKQHRKSEESRNEIKIDELIVPDHIHNLINEYIDITNNSKESQWLISYECFFKFYPTKLRKKESFLARFDTKDLYLLLRLFYKNIVIKQYNLPVKRELKNGDLRHIAITSMMLQGYDRAAIEKFAGHINIDSQNPYTNHMHFWIDGEIQYLSNQFRFINNKDYIAPEAMDTFNIIFDKTINEEIIKRANLHEKKQADNKYIELELGSCTEETMPCPTLNSNLSSCYYCEHWQISSQELHNNKEKILSEISVIYDDLHRKINYLSGLYNLHNLNEYGEFRKDVKTKLIRTKQEINRDKELLAKFKFFTEGD